jgi:alpha-L-rhamnosidase
MTASASGAPSTGGSASTAGAAATTGGVGTAGDGTGGAPPLAGQAGNSGAGDSGTAGAGPSVDPIAPSGLMCELLKNPVASPLTDAKPEFSWIVNSPRKNVKQGAYQILVAATRAALDGDQGDAWDSGKVASADSINVPYAGAPLVAAQHYFWKVRTWEATGEAGSWSAPQEIVMAASLGAYSTPRPPVVQTRVAPAKFVTVAPGHYFVDFGRDAFGWLELSLNAAAASAIDVHLGEKAKGNAVDTAPGATIRYVKVQLSLKAGQNTYRVETPKDTRNTTGDAFPLPAALGVVMPFRYVELVNAPANLDQTMLQQVTVHYPFDVAASSFKSSSPALDQVWDLSKYSISAPTFADVYLDGDRERIPYEGDAYLQQLGHYGTDRDFALARFSHEYLLTHPTWPTEWKQHSVMMAWADWMYSGNTESLAQAYDRLVKEKTLETNVNADGLLDTSSLEDLVDWPEGERDGHVLTGVNTVVNAFWCRNLQQMADIAGALGKTADAERYRTAAAKAIAALNGKLVDGATGLYVDGVGVTHSSLHSNMMPLAFGLVPADRRAKVLAFVKGRGMACSVYGAQYLLEALYQAGAPDAALALMTATTDRGWLNMIKVGATITMEAWDAKYKPNLDWNHAWGAAPANILPRYLLGVQPLTPGFGSLAIRPQLGGLTHAEGLVPSIRGPIKVSVDAAAGQPLLMTVELPANLTANLALPDAAPATCKPLLDGAAATVVVRDGVSWIDGVGSGAHEVRCQ